MDRVRERTTLNKDEERKRFLQFVHICTKVIYQPLCMYIHEYMCMYVLACVNLNACVCINLFPSALLFRCSQPLGRRSARCDWLLAKEPSTATFHASSAAIRSQQFLPKKISILEIFLLRDQNITNELLYLHVYIFIEQYRFIFICAYLLTYVCIRACMPYTIAYAWRVHIYTLSQEYVFIAVRIHFICLYISV